jgi:hypothetical protein
LGAGLGEAAGDEEFVETEARDSGFRRFDGRGKSVTSGE